MIVGLGTDLVEIARIEASVTRFGERFLNRIYTPGEIDYCMARRRGAAESLAARFAAKEAAAKALGTGIGRGVSWLDLEVTRAAGAPPELLLHGMARQRAAKLGVRRISLSLTHGQAQAMAIVVMEG